MASVERGHCPNANLGAARRTKQRQREERAAEKRKAHLEFDPFFPLGAYARHLPQNASRFGPASEFEALEI